ncbi:MAG: hypothetical protein ACR2ME_09935 [Acidimicrobiia bacterium]
MTDDLQPRALIVRPSVLVGPVTCLALAAFLRSHREAWREHAARYSAGAPEMSFEIQALEMAAKLFTSSQFPAALPEAEADLSSPSMVTPWEAAGRRNCTERWIRQLLTDGRLPGRKINGRWLVDVEGLESDGK